MTTRAARSDGARLPVLLGVAAAVGLGVAGCGDRDAPPPSEVSRAATGTTDTVVDAAGTAHAFPRPPERLVSLVPAATRTILALGAGERLVGRTDYDTLAVLDSVPSVGDGLHPSAEVLLSLDPDLVIRFAGESDPTTPARLDARSVPHFAVAPETVDDARSMIRTLGAVLHRRDVADSVVARIDRRLAGIGERVEGLPPVRTAFLVGGEPPWVAGPRTFIHELIQTAGGVNVFGDMEKRWTRVSPEAFLAREVDVFLAAEGTTLDPRLTDGTPVRPLPPVVQLPGPELDQAALAVARALRPELFR